MNQKKFSLVVLTRNSQGFVQDNIVKINDYMEKLNLENYEIIVADYSEDDTFTILKKLEKKYKTIKAVEAPRRGIGCGVITGIDLVNFEYVMCYPIDMTWDISIIKKSIEKLYEGYDVVLGSRRISGSITKRPWKRRIFSVSYNLFINLLFNLKIKDTQCTFALKRSDYQKYRKNLEDDGPFLQTELLIYSKMKGLKILEIPTVVTDMRKDSSINVFSFGYNMMHKAIRKKINLIKLRKNISFDD